MKHRSPSVYQPNGGASTGRKRATKRTLLIGRSLYTVYRATPMIPAGLLRCDKVIAVNTRHDHPADETLFHEMFHACEYELIETGALKQPNSEEYVESMALILYHALKQAGFLRMEVEWDQLNLPGADE